ncbi:type II secretion system F family protein [Tumebacillus lipolyticus]|uniref:Type II secretion system F family protein n=1 Tax=Tumebacillus lipolyticus TaxID=1280370 RepID=A0ABW4ZUL2_9BACL
MSRRLQVADWGAFARRLALLLEGGIPLLEALSALVERGGSKERVWIPDLQASLQAGHSLSSLLKSKRAPLMMQALVEIGEHAGDLAGSLFRSSDYCTMQVSWRRERRQAMLYPLLVGVVLTFLSLFLFTVVVPRFADLYAGLGLQVEGMAQVLFSLSASFPQLVLASALIVASLFMWKKRWKDVGTFSGVRLLRRVPFLRRLLLVERTHEWVATLGLLLDGGVSLLQALQIQERLPLHVENRGACLRIRERVSSGSSLGEAVLCERFDSALAHAVGVAEVTGDLGRALLSLERDLSDQRKAMMALVSKCLEPILLLIAGGMVGLVTLLMLWPMLDLIRAI